MLDGRKLEVLYAIINSHLLSAEPIGSRTISKDYNLGVSPATIRNEMSDLEDKGYLTKPHSSAGRIPSDKAYRLYVNNLLKQASREVNKEKENDIKEILYRESRELEDLVRNSARLLTKITSYTSMAILPEMNKSKLKHIQLILMETEEILMVVVSSSGIIRNHIFKLEEALTSDDLMALSNYLNQKYAGLIMSDIIISLRTVELTRAYPGMATIVIELLKVLRDVNNIEIYANGVTKILNFPEYNDLEKAKSFMNFMENRDLVIDVMMQDDRDEDLEITIGQENIHDEMKECSIITANYKLGDMTIGKIGIVGPTRMDYYRLISTLRNFSKDISEVIGALTK